MGARYSGHLRELLRPLGVYDLSPESLSGSELEALGAGLDALSDRLDDVERESALSHYNSMNVLSMHALVGAYKPEGQAWLDELLEVLPGNINYACDYIEKHFEGVTTSKSEATYMLFVDCTGWCKAHNKTIEELEKACWDVGVALQDGKMFHGPCHIRVNLALPLARVEEAFRRLDKYVFNA